MPFPTKTSDEVVAEFMQSLADQGSPLARAKPGSFVYFVARAVGGVVATGYRALNAVRQEFFVSLATGSALKRRVRDLGMEPDPGEFATGGVILSLPPGQTTTLPSGTVLYARSDRNLQFELLQTVTVDGTVRQVPVIATDVGDRFNLSAGTPLYANRTDMAEARVLVSSNAPLDGLIPDGELKGGRNPESDAEIKNRFPKYLKSFARGVGYAVLAALKSVPGLRPVAIKNAQPVPGYFTIVTGNDATELTDALRASAELVLDEWAAAGFGFEFETLQRRRVTIEVTATVSDPGVSLATYESAIAAAILAAVDALEQGDSLYRSEIVRAGKLKGVSDLEVLQPASSVLANPTELIVADGVVVHATYS